MQPTTVEIVRAALKADPSIDAEKRNRLLSALTTDAGCVPPPTDALLRPAEVARILGRSVRAVHQLAQSGALSKVTLPGRTRAAGFRRSDVEALLKGGAV